MSAGIITVENVDRCAKIGYWLIGMVGWLYIIRFCDHMLNGER